MKHIGHKSPLASPLSFAPITFSLVASADGQDSFHIPCKEGKRWLDIETTGMITGIPIHERNKRDATRRGDSTTPVRAAGCWKINDETMTAVGSRNAPNMSLTNLVMLIVASGSATKVF